jgi:RimJ/RimL family protein N-acetyltransferase
MAAEPIESERLRLEPLTVSHGARMVGVLADSSIYRFTGGEAPTALTLARRYRAQVIGHSADGCTGWLNWIVTLAATSAPIGFVQATLTERSLTERSHTQRSLTERSHTERSHTERSHTERSHTEWSLTQRSQVVADLAWVVTPAHQGRGLASEAAIAMTVWLADHGVDRFAANIHPQNEASAAVARTVGLHPTSAIVDGEVRWES